MDPLEQALQQVYGTPASTGGSTTAPTPSQQSLLDAALAQEYGPAPQSTPSNPYWQTAKDIGGAVLKGAEDFGAGAGSNVGNTLFGTASLVPRVAGATAGLFGAEGFHEKMSGLADSIQKVGHETFDAAPDFTKFMGRTDPNLPQVDSTAGKFGGFISDAAMLMAPGGPATAVTRGQKLLQVGADVAKIGTDGIPLLGKLFGKGLDVAAHVAPEAGLGYAYGMAHDPENASQDALLFGLGSAGGQAVGAISRKLKGTVVDNVAKAFGTKGKVGNTVGAKSVGVVDSNVGAMETLYDLKDKIKVADANGNVKLFDPVNTNLPEMVQAVNQGKEITFKLYDEMATKAGDAGAKFSQKDFESIVKPLQDVLENKNAGSTIRGIADAELKDMLNSYAMKDAEGAIVYKDGVPQFHDASLKDIQEYIQLNLVPRIISKIQDQNTRILGQQLKTMRDALDSKIENAGGDGYNEMRQRYAQLKTLEQGVAFRFNQEIGRRKGGVPDWVQGFGGIDILQGLITANPSKMTHGFFQVLLGRIAESYRNTDPYIRNAFKSIADSKGAQESARKDFMQRVFGTPDTPAVMPKRPKMDLTDVPTPDIEQTVVGQ